MSYGYCTRAGRLEHQNIHARRLPPGTIKQEEAGRTASELIGIHRTNTSDDNDNKRGDLHNAMNEIKRQGPVK